jgi:hypothetical protein
MFDYLYGDASIFTELQFKPKSSDKKEFSVILYPNSVFIIPLSTNRDYTHRIKAPTLPKKFHPTRLGYVVRSAETTALFVKDGHIEVEDNKEKYVLEPATEESIKRLRELYYRENTTTDIIDYSGTDLKFSFNLGDYMKPNIKDRFE